MIVFAMLILMHQLLLVSPALTITSTSTVFQAVLRTCRETSVSTTTSPFGCPTDANECPTPMSYHDANSYLDDLSFAFETGSFSLDVGNEFRTSQKNSFDLDYRKQRHHGGHSLPTTMAFADELFCDGKVMPLATPLKLPPRLQRKKYEKLADQMEKCASVPGSPNHFVLKLPFRYRRLWNDEFDPFMAALKNVKEEKKEKAGSMSPAANNQSPNDPDDQDHSTTYTNEPVSKEVTIILKRLAEPRGVELARQVRLIQMEHMSKQFDKLGKQSERDEKAESMEKKPTFLRRLSFKSGRGGQCREEKRPTSNSHPQAQLSKMALIQYKPRGVALLGLQGKLVRQMPGPFGNCHAYTNYV